MSLIQEIIIFIRCEIRLSRCLATKGLTVTNLLQIVKSTGDTLVTGAVECIEADAGATIHTGVNLGASKNRIAICIHDARRRGCIGIYEISIGVGRIVRTIHVAITKRRLDDRKGRYGLAIALKLGPALLVSGLDGSFNFGDGLGIRFRDALYFGVPPLMDFGSQTLAYDQRVSGPVITFIGLLIFTFLFI